jgi:hypothetical protein
MPVMVEPSRGGYCLVMSSICHGATKEAVYNNILISAALRRTLITRYFTSSGCFWLIIITLTNSNFVWIDRHV